MSEERLTRLTAALPALGLVLSLVLSEPPAVLLLSVSAILFHEMGHLCCFLLLGLPRPALAANGTGVRLLPKLPLTPFEEGVIALGGPVFNLLASLLFFSLGGGFGALAGSLHLLYGLFNLLPFAATDGERILRLFLGYFSPKAAKKTVLLLSRVLLTALFFFSLFLYYLTGYGLCGLFFSLFCYFSPE